MAPGGRKLKTVDSGMDHLFEDDEDGDGASRRRQKELGEEGDMDEQVYEADFADDDEHMEVDDNDEEAKEAEVCCRGNLRWTFDLLGFCRRGLRRSIRLLTSNGRPVSMNQRKKSSCLPRASNRKPCRSSFVTEKGTTHMNRMRRRILMPVLL